MQLSERDSTLIEITHMHAGVWFGWTESGQSFTMVRHGDALSVELGRMGLVYWNDNVPRNLSRAQLLKLCGFRLQGQEKEEEEQTA